jgi:hypothetical protein
MDEVKEFLRLSMISTLSEKVEIMDDLPDIANASWVKMLGEEKRAEWSMIAKIILFSR